MFRIKQEMIDAIVEIEKEAKNLEEKKQEILKDYGVVSENGLTIEEKEKFQKQLNENAQYGEAGRGRHKVVYTHPDKKNVGNDRFEHKHEAEKYKKSLEKKGYHNVHITEEDLNEAVVGTAKHLAGLMRKYDVHSKQAHRNGEIGKDKIAATHRDKADSYKQEALKHYGHYKDETGKRMKNNFDYYNFSHGNDYEKNAQSWIDRNTKHVKEEDLNEISKKTLSSYLERAPLQSVNHAMSAETYREGAKKSAAASRRKGLSDASVERHKAEEARKSTEMQKHLRKKTNRLLGTKIASNKLYGIGRPKVLATEETQSLDEISASLADRYLTKSAKERSERKHKKDREPSRKVAYNKMLAHDDKNDAPVKVKTGTRPKAMEMATADISKTFSPEGYAKLISREKTARDSDPKFQEFKKRNNKE